MRAFTLLIAFTILFTVTSCKKIEVNPTNPLGNEMFITGDGMNNLLFSISTSNSQTEVSYDSGQTNVVNLDLISQGGTGGGFNLLIPGADTAGTRTVLLGDITVRVGQSVRQYLRVSGTAVIIRYDPFTSNTAVVSGTFKGTFSRPTQNGTARITVTGKFSGFRTS